MALIAQGLRNHEVGERLGIEERTVESHCAAIKRTLGLEASDDLRFGVMANWRREA